ncbi:cupin domain-containing protein [Arthrobacter sp. MI7-26]|uniref:cupin domain-containing protein n=1 Tax=Arthrobacter sp. MI7-26 TaxID=2993653 RepID=UPI002248B411|nr:cupin domain-containing protein [Arthrobacter sp. MI7-26]MCX2747876.1 cupin domain-containing protein [Arthrobacter sp. MI7-26]
MDPELIPGSPVNVGELTLPHEAVPPGQTASGAPTTGIQSLGTFSGLELGTWEMTTGGMHDLEVEELFLVTAGRATLEIHYDTGEAKRLPLGPGALMRLNAGMRTTWTVHETLRKVYLTPSSEPNKHT